MSFNFPEATKKVVVPFYSLVRKMSMFVWRGNTKKRRNEKEKKEQRTIGFDDACSTVPIFALLIRGQLTRIVLLLMHGCVCVRMRMHNKRIDI